jgi:hypothetical protein
MSHESCYMSHVTTGSDWGSGQLSLPAAAAAATAAVFTVKFFGKFNGKLFESMTLLLLLLPLLLLVVVNGRLLKGFNSVLPAKDQAEQEKPQQQQQQQQQAAVATQSPSTGKVTGRQTEIAGHAQSVRSLVPFTLAAQQSRLQQ